MDDWSQTPQSDVVDRLTPVPTELRQTLRRGPFDKAGHDHWFDALPCLRQIETGGAVARRMGAISVRSPRACATPKPT
jgi:hypothetical protein